MQSMVTLRHLSFPTECTKGGDWGQMFSKLGHFSAEQSPLLILLLFYSFTVLFFYYSISFTILLPFLLVF